MAEERTAGKGAGIPGIAHSFWIGTGPEPEEPRVLEGNRTVDVGIIGGGITGLTTALLLARSGASVALVDADRLAHGVSGQTTAKVTCAHGIAYSRLDGQYGRERTRLYAEANRAALEWIASTVEEHKIECDFARVPSYVYTESQGSVETLRREAESAAAHGFDATFSDGTPLPFAVSGACRFADQARFHPVKYLLALGDLAREAGAELYENTRVLNVSDEKRCRVTTDGGQLFCDRLLVATHYPIYDPSLFFTRLYQSRGYVYAATLPGDGPDALFYRIDEGEYSFRVQPGPDGTATGIVGDESHKAGQGGDTVKRYLRLAGYVRDRFGATDFQYRWSTQDCYSMDGVPFVGRASPGGDRIFLATAYGGWGMTGGTAAGMMLSDVFSGRDNPAGELFDPFKRVSAKGARKFLEQNVNVGGWYGRNWARRLRVRKRPEDLQAGEASYVRTARGAAAAYRDEDGELHMVSPTCTHLRCAVSWNEAEKSWDCPCHGSRFNVDGQVLHPPAKSALPPVEG